MASVTAVDRLRAAQRHLRVSDRRTARRVDGPANQAAENAKHSSGAIIAYAASRDAQAQAFFILLDVNSRVMDNRSAHACARSFEGWRACNGPSRIEIGPFALRGVPAILLGVTGIVLASGVTAALSKGATRLPETLGEARGLARTRSARSAGSPRLRIVIENDALDAPDSRRTARRGRRIVDRTGTMDHFNVTVRSRAFKGKTLIEQHQLVYGALKAALKDGRVHAVELKTIVAEN